MTEKVELNYRLEEPRLVASLEMSVEGDPKAHMFLSADDLSNLIHALGGLRSAMADEVPKELDHKLRVEALTDPAWRFVKTSDRKQKMLGLRHPGFGWLWFAFPNAEAAAIAAWLTSQQE